MDIQLYLVNLREQNQYLGQLSSQIETALQGIETTFQAHHDPQIIETIAQLHRCLCVEAETFCKRLNLTLRGSPDGKRSPSPAGHDVIIQRRTQ